MSSLSGAPKLGGAAKGTGVSFNYNTTPAEAEKAKKDKKKDKTDKKDKKTAKTSSSSDNKKSDIEEEAYDDDFEESPLSAPVASASATNNSAASNAAIAALASQFEARQKEEEKRLREEREAHERRVREWTQQREEQARKDALELNARREADKRSAAEILAKQEEAAKRLQEQQSLLSEQLTSLMTHQQQQQQLVQQQQQQPRYKDPSNDFSDEEEPNRRKRREKERDKDFKRLQEEEAAHSLFHRLAKDVREVFNELNMSVVAAEKERLLKDDRYRKEREARDRREEAERIEKTQRLDKERAEREEKFWQLLTDRESRYTELLEKRALKDDTDRDERLNRDLDDRTQRFKSDRDARDGIERLDRERRDREEALVIDRERKLIQSQVDDVRKQFNDQCDEIRRQFEVERHHLAETHKIEIAAMERRNIEALAVSDKYHKDYALSMEAHAANAAKLEALIAMSNEAVTETRRMVETDSDKRLAIVKQREAASIEQHELVKTVLMDVTTTRDSLEQERHRVAALYSKLDLSITSFNRANEDWQRKFEEARAHYDTLRQQLEKDKKAMIYEVSQERKLVEHQHEAFIDDKMKSISEIQAERMAIMKERTEAALARERHNKDESTLLLSLRTKEEEYQCRLEAIAADRDLANDLRREAQRLRDEAASERENLRRERSGLEQERDNIMMRVEYVRQKADDAIGDQNRLRKELATERAATIGRSASVPQIAPPSAATNFHYELARQRAALSRISENMM